MTLLPDGEYLVEGDIGAVNHKGILRKVLHPGRYRINPYGYSVQVVETQTFTSGNQEKHAGWVEIPTGYVGVVTNLSKNSTTHEETGIQDKVLPPESTRSTVKNNRSISSKSVTVTPPYKWK
ncbi:MAG: hypothetical protein R3C11_28425 [Planctomycetaceae bacterium]